MTLKHCFFHITNVNCDTNRDTRNLFQELNPLNSNLTPDKTPIVYMNNTYPNDESPEDKWNQPEADSKHYLAFDFHKVRFQKKKEYTQSFSQRLRKVTPLLME